MIENSFIHYLRYEKRFSPHTLTAYQIDLNQFSKFLALQFEIEQFTEVTHPIVRSWIVSMMDLKLSTRTINRKITVLKTYFRFLIKSGLVSDNPMTKVVSPKTSKRLPVYVEKSAMEKLLVEIKFEEGFEGARDRLILELFYNTGMRLAELINIKEVDFDTYNSTIKVLGKRNKERIIPVSSALGNQIKQYLALLNAKFSASEKDENLFLNNKGKKPGPKFVYSIVNRYLSQVTTLEKKSPHVLRHTFATHMLNNGADINAVKELLGHSSLAATQVYTHNTIEKLKSVYKQAHPRA